MKTELTYELAVKLFRYDDGKLYWRERTPDMFPGLWNMSEDAIAARNAANVTHGYHANHGA